MGFQGGGRLTDKGARRAPATRIWSLFRKGTIGGWRSHFIEEHKAAVKEQAGQHLIFDLGYESDDDW